MKSILKPQLFINARFSEILRAVFLCVPLLVGALALRDPFHGDGIATVARAALHMHAHFNLTVWYPPGLPDPGHPTLFPWTLAGLWRLTGLSLPAAHLFSACFGLGAAWQFDRLAGAFLKPACRTAALGLFVVSPYFLAQSAMILTHLPLTFAYLGALNAMRSERPRALAFWGCGLMLLHLEASFLWLGLFCAWTALNWRSEKKLKPALRYGWAWAAPVGVLGLWLWAHYQHAGWALLSPDYAAHRETAGGLFRFLKNLALSGWRLTDLGHFALFAAAGALLWRAAPERRKALLRAAPSILALVPALILALCVAWLLSNTNAHRYFLPALAPVFVWAAWLFQETNGRPRIQKAWLAGIAACLLAGNFWHYPGKCVGDANLVYRSYFEVERQIKAEHPDKTFFTYAPLSNSSFYRYLNYDDGLSAARLYERDLEDVRYVLVSNLTCEFSPEERRTLENWPGETYQSGQVWATIYCNPKFCEDDFGGAKRKPGPAERFMRKLKETLR